MNTTSHRVYQTGEGERGSEVAANDLGRLRIRLSKNLERSATSNIKETTLDDLVSIMFYWEQSF